MVGLRLKKNRPDCKFTVCCRRTLGMSEVDTIVILMHEFDYFLLHSRAGAFEQLSRACA